MRAFGLAMILIGVVAIVLPAYAEMLPRLPLGASDLRLLGGGLLILGGVGLWVTRSR
jgi:uncharacterized membrane protein